MNAIRQLPANVMRTLGEHLLHGHSDVTAEDAFCRAAWPALEGAQAGIAVALRDQEGSAALESLTAALHEADAAHDRLVTLLHMGLTVGSLSAAHEGDGADAALLDGCRRCLLPEGRRQKSKPWHEEAGDAAVYASRLSEAQALRLERLLIAGVPAMQRVREWVAAAEAIGALLNQRGKVASQVDAQADLRAARITWGETFATFLDALKVSGLGAADQEALRRPFADAVAMHQARLAQRAPTPTPLNDAPTPEPAPLPA